MTLKLGLIGARGRMGRAIAAVAELEGIAVAGGIGREDGPAALAELARTADVLVDFSAPETLEETLAAAEAARVPLLVGTTGLGPAHQAALDLAAAGIAILQTANTSLGVALLARLVEQAARALGPAWDVEVVEMHHRHKRDAPSGTALLLGAAANRGRGAVDGQALNRMERPGIREPGGVYYASLRGGSVAGDHQVVFAGEGERIELGHRAEGRETFARGAIAAARWLHGRAPGRYAMADVLGLA